MKEYKSPKMVAKNAPTGSYAAGCPANEGGMGRDYLSPRCVSCERAI
ncbi:MAG: hypothetical protein J1E95_12305 [Muribaculaceae bacterium]|nr:hypothetical protein [Muribaculaceae bacterium]